MTTTPDICSICIYKGNINNCIKTGCKTANSWIVKELLAKLEQLESKQKQACKNCRRYGRL